MSDLVRIIRRELPSSCIVEVCEEDDCCVDLDGAPAPNIIVDFDKPGSPLGVSAIRCDYLFVADDGPGWVVPLELTSGTSKPPEQVVQQLGAGAKIAAEYLVAGGDVNFRPVFVGKADKRMRKHLGSHKLSFHRKKRGATWMDCGESLRYALMK